MKEKAENRQDPLTLEEVEVFIDEHFKDDRTQKQISMRRRRVHT